MMPQISEITDAMNAPMDESATSTSLMISSSTPEQEPPVSRALRVRKSNTKSSCSNSRSSSSSSSRPPVPDAGGYHTGVRDLWFCQGLNMPRQRVPNP